MAEGGCVKKGTACEDGERALHSTYGFWIFPIGVCGPIPSASNQIHNTDKARRTGKPQLWDLLKACDIPEHKPELYLQHPPVAPLPKLNVRLMDLKDQGALALRPKRPAKRKWGLYRPEISIEAYICRN